MSLWWSIAAAQEAERGQWDAEVALDMLHATSQAAPPAGGPTEGLAATELGMRVLGRVETGAVVAAVDYQGREAVGGTFQTTPARLFYRAEVVGTVAKDRLDLAAGRFVAPSVTFLAVDGARAEWRPSDLVSLQLFGGRRGVSTSMRPLGFGTLLPAVGGGGGIHGGRGAAEVLVSLAGDEAELPNGDVEAPTIETWQSVAATARGHVAPLAEKLVLGASGTLSQRASFVFLPTPGSAQVTAQALDLYQGFGYARWRPADAVRLDLDVLHQEANLEFAGADQDPDRDGIQLPGGVDVTVIDPTFTDLRTRGALALADHGWLRPDVRLRLRTGRTEFRYGVGADLTDLFTRGPFVRARFWFEDIGMNGEGDDVGAIDRVLWSGSAGWSSGPVEAELGASRMDRAAAPVSGRTEGRTTSEDLNAFVLEAQDIAFARAFVTDRTRFGGWFGGLDAELNVSAEPEIRAFVQVGLLGDGSW